MGGPGGGDGHGHVKCQSRPSINQTTVDFSATHLVPLTHLANFSMRLDEKEQSNCPLLIAT